MTDERTVEQDRPQRPDFITGVMGRYYWKAIADAYMDAQDAEIARLREELAKDKWISVEDRLPSEEDDYLTALSDGEVVMCYFIGGEWDGDGARGSSADFDISYWKPLPSAPAPEKEKPQSAAKMAEQFCDAMIENLRQNVGEQKLRLKGKF